jgi:uncharacterized protein
LAKNSRAKIDLSPVAETLVSSFQTIKESRLPIFFQDQEDKTLFYAPGYLVVVPCDLVQGFFEKIIGIGANINSDPMVDSLVQHAKLAVAARQKLRSEPYEPVCITYYLNNICNLNCLYCYSEPGAKRGLSLPFPIAISAAERVAQNCARQGLPLTVAFHGGGEPTIDHHLMESILDELELLARRYQIKLFRYIATNGVMPEDQAKWLARRFDLIGLSCDGPSDIQGDQRPLLNGENSLPWIFRTVRLIHEAGKELHIRSTLTSNIFNRQEEIAQYLCSSLHPSEIHVEPVYLAGRAANNKTPGKKDAETFVENFFTAKRTAWSFGVKWTTSGTRPGEIHGPHCHVFRQVLNLTPEGLATNCFKEVLSERITLSGALIGSYAPEKASYAIHSEHAQSLQKQLGIVPISCQSCFNQFHCTLGCPDHCPDQSDLNPEGFRCQVNQKLVMKTLTEMARKMINMNSKSNPIVGQKLAPGSI